MTDLPKLARPSFFDGQLLTASDLDSVQGYHRDLLWLHQRTLHSAGIASGFGITGKKGDKAVVIAPGYAVDTEGRSIVLTDQRVLPIPAVVGGPTGGAVTYYLTVSYATDDQLASSTRSGTCGSNGAVRRPDEPVIQWREPSDVGDGLVLCGIAVQNCKLAVQVDLSLRRSAIPDRQPFVYAGQTLPAENSWGLWRPGDSAAAAPVGLKVSINTSEAGFANTPRYQASVVGSREFDTPDGKSTAVVDGYVQLTNVSAAGFEVHMALPPGNARVNPGWALTAAKLPSLPVMNRWYVSWVGVEG